MGVGVVGWGMCRGDSPLRASGFVWKDKSLRLNVSECVWMCLNVPWLRLDLSGRIRNLRLNVSECPLPASGSVWKDKNLRLNVSECV